MLVEGEKGQYISKRNPIFDELALQPMCSELDGHIPTNSLYPEFSCKAGQHPIQPGSQCSFRSLLIQLCLI